VAQTIAERVGDIDRFFPRAVDVGCGRGHFAKAASEDLVGSLDQCDMSRHVLVSSKVKRIGGFFPTKFYFTHSKLQ